MVRRYVMVDLNMRLRQRTLKWFGHVKREEGNIMRRVEEMKERTQVARKT